MQSLLGPVDAKEEGEMKHVWIIEMYDDMRKEWSPTVGEALTRADAKLEKIIWAKRNPYDRFRIRKYVQDAAQD